MDNEIWKPVIWFEWLYEVSNLWRIKSFKNWRSVEVKSIYPTDADAIESLNTLIGYCVSKWMKPWDYKDSKDLCINMIPWVELLRAKVFNSNL